MAAFVSKMGVFSQFSWSLNFGAKMAEFPLPVLQIWQSRKRVAIQIQLMNFHVSECKYHCLHLVPKFGDMCDRQNWRLHPTRSRPNQIAGPGPKSGPARKSESRGPENGVSRWRRPNSDIYSQNHHFDLVYDMIYQFLGMEAKNYKFGMFCQQCHPSVASGDADIRPRNASRIHTCHLFTS